MIETISQEIQDEAWNQCEPNLDANGDYDYNDHECSSTDDSNVEFSKTQLKERLVGFLRERHPHLLEELA